MEIQKTKDYKQFKTIKGNRKIDMSHVNKLITLNSEINQLWQYPGTVTKDGYLWDGQHRLEAAKAQEWDFFYTTSDKVLSELRTNLVPITNTSQLKWQIADYINYYARNGKEQYLYLEELIQEYGWSHALIISLLRGESKSAALKKGILSLFENEDDKEYNRLLLDGYRDIVDAVPAVVYRDSIFARAMREIFKQLSSEDVKRTLEKTTTQIVSMRHKADYLRQFETLYNHGRQEKNYLRLF